MPMSILGGASGSLGFDFDLDFGISISISKGLRFQINLTRLDSILGLDFEQGSVLLFMMANHGRVVDQRPRRIVRAELVLELEQCWSWRRRETSAALEAVWAEP